MTNLQAPLSDAHSGRNKTINMATATLLSRLGTANLDQTNPRRSGAWVAMSLVDIFCLWKYDNQVHTVFAANLDVCVFVSSSNLSKGRNLREVRKVVGRGATADDGP